MQVAATAYLRTNMTEEELRTRFDAVDADRDGLLSVDEVTALLSVCGLARSGSAEFQELISMAPLPFARIA